MPAFNAVTHDRNQVLYRNKKAALTWGKADSSAHAKTIFSAIFIIQLFVAYAQLLQNERLLFFSMLPGSALLFFLLYKTLFKYIPLPEYATFVQRFHNRIYKVFITQLIVMAIYAIIIQSGNVLLVPACVLAVITLREFIRYRRR